jgi:hypothetical protein
MSVSDLEEWKSSDAYADYEEYHDRQDWADEDVSAIVARAKRVIKGSASEDDVEMVEHFIGRHVKQDAGKRKYGSGRSKVSAHTAALRNWGFDPTGKFS